MAIWIRLLCVSLIVSGMWGGSAEASALACQQLFGTREIRPEILNRAVGASQEVAEFIRRGHFQNAAFLLYRLRHPKIARELEQWIERELATGDISEIKTGDHEKNASHFFHVTFASGLKAIFKSPDLSKGRQTDAFVNPGYEVAAYELDRLFHLRTVPVTVLREVPLHKGKPWMFSGSLQAVVEWPDGPNWIDVHSPHWVVSTRLVRIFDYLINNHDRHDGNFIPSYYQMGAIDHGAAFEREGQELGRFPPLVLEKQPADHRYGAFIRAIERPSLRSVREILERRGVDERRIEELLERRRRLVHQFYVNLATGRTVADYELEVRQRPRQPGMFENALRIWNPWVGW